MAHAPCTCSCVCVDRPAPARLRISRRPYDAAVQLCVHWNEWDQLAALQRQQQQQQQGRSGAVAADPASVLDDLASPELLYMHQWAPIASVAASERAQTSAADTVSACIRHVRERRCTHGQ
jgi:hypothetical protein